MCGLQFAEYCIHYVKTHKQTDGHTHVHICTFITNKTRSAHYLYKYKICGTTHYTNSLSLSLSPPVPLSLPPPPSLSLSPPPPLSLPVSLSQGDILLVANEFTDGWMRGLRLSDLEVTIDLQLNNITMIEKHHLTLYFLFTQVGFFPAGFVVEDTSPIYKLK